MNRKSGAFGAPKPLPGQSGYGMRESDRLETETNQIAQRLQALKAQMAREKEQKKNAPKNSSKAGDSRWKSASGSRGSVRNYAKEVKERKKPSKASRPRHKSRPSSSSSKEVSEWGVSETTDWLVSIGLKQYAGIFEQNEISGSVLLEVGLDDLDYMEIRVLGHRKILLKGIEDLKINGRQSVKLDATPSYSSRQPPAPPSFQAVMHKDEEEEERYVSPVPAKPAAPTKEQRSMVHWSQAKPLSENKIAPATRVPVNSADAGASTTTTSASLSSVNGGGRGGDGTSTSLADGVYDEEAAARDFQAAVASWRGGKTEVEDDAAPEEDGLWHNSVEDDAAPKEDGLWHNPWAPVAEPPCKTAPPPRSKDVQGGTDDSLGDLASSEADEHAKFADAVQSWRNGAKGDSATARSHVQKVASQMVTGGAGSESTPRSASQVAKDLAKRLDAGYASDARILMEQRESAQRKLETQERELAESHRSKATLQMRYVEEGDDTSPPLSPVNSLSPPDSPPRRISISGNIDVSLVGSTLGTAAYEGAAGYTVVEEESDDDE